MVQHDVVGLRKQRWITLGGDRGRHEQVRHGSQDDFPPLCHGPGRVAKDRRQAHRWTGLPKLGSGAVEMTAELRGWSYHHWNTPQDFTDF